eukprot:4220619-Alexandrium_andersonii.AAC.1
MACPYMSLAERQEPEHMRRQQLPQCRHLAGRERPTCCSKGGDWAAGESSRAPRSHNGRT